jgi:hypothetical protein
MLFLFNLTIKQEEQMGEVKLSQVLGEVAFYFEGWAVCDEYEHYGYLAHLATGAKISMRLEKGRLQVSSAINGIWGMETYQKISVSASRPAEAIANEIRRRVLPGYIEAFIAGQERVAKREAAANEQAAWVTGLTEKYDALHLEHDHSRNVSGVSCTVGEARISLDYPRYTSGVSMTMHWLTRDQAEAVMAALLKSGEGVTKEQAWHLIHALNAITEITPEWEVEHLADGYSTVRDTESGVVAEVRLRGAQSPNVDKKKVVITVRGGVAEVAEESDGVEVEIIDYDGDNCDMCGEPLPNDHEGWVCVDCMEEFNE